MALLNAVADQAIVVEQRLSCQSGEFYVTIFGDFMMSVDTLKRPVHDGRLSASASERASASDIGFPGRNPMSKHPERPGVTRQVAPDACYLIAFLTAPAADPRLPG